MPEQDDLIARLREAAAEVRAENRAGWGNAFEFAAEEIERLERQIDVMFDGNAVLAALTEHAQKRTSPENVSDVLDAAWKVMKERAKSEQAQKESNDA